MDHNFSKLIASTSNARMRIRLLAISHFTDGKNRTDIAKFLKVSRTSVNKWVTQYLSEGLDSLTEKPQGGRLQGKDVQRNTTTRIWAEKGT